MKSTIIRKVGLTLAIFAGAALTPVAADESKVTVRGSVPTVNEIAGRSSYRHNAVAPVEYFTTRVGSTVDKIGRANFVPGTASGGPAATTGSSKGTNVSTIYGRSSSNLY
ncbi:MAG: hypothetical protein ACREVG_17215 [Burkholderiales bacterium]